MESRMEFQVKSQMESQVKSQGKTQTEAAGAGTKKTWLPKILLCDGEPFYGERLAEYLQCHLPFAFDIELYSSREKLLEKGKWDKASLIIISEREYDKGAFETGACELLVLNETERYLGEVRNVSKYQSMDSMLEVIRPLVLEDEQAVPGRMRHGHPMHLIGFYSPVSRCLQTTAALTFGQFLAGRHQVLYINFETYSGMEQLLGQRFHGSAADLLYYNECARDRLPAQLGLLTYRLGGLDYIPPMKSFLELRATEADKWVSLFRSIEQATEYEYVILDLSESAEGLLDLLRSCERVFTIVREDPLSMAKIHAYEQLLQEMGYADVAVKTRRWQFCVFQELPAAMDNLTHGEMADYVRTLMEADGYDAGDSRGER